MMLKTKIAAFVSALILAGAAFAEQQSICPNINSIKAEGLTMAEQLAENMFLTYNISTYDTAKNWGFFIVAIEGDSEEVALETANEILSTMNAPGVPEEIENAIICKYETGHDQLYAAAISDETQITPMRLKYFYKKGR